jgi:ATP-dependent Lon protease
LPWVSPADLAIDRGVAHQIPEADHFGLECVKRRTVEFLSAKKLNPQGRAPLLGLVGLPSVGQTSLGELVACAGGRLVMWVLFGGVHDEAEIRGHRRAGVGAMPAT